MSNRVRTATVLSLLFCLSSVCEGDAEPVSLKVYYDDVLQRARTGCASHGLTKCKAVDYLVTLEKDVAIDRRCKTPLRGQCLTRATAVKKKLDEMSLLAEGLNSRISSNYRSRWDLEGDLKNPKRIATNAGREAKNIGKQVGALVPRDKSCVHQTINPNYHAAREFINDNKELLARNGTRDRATCMSNRKKIAAISAAYTHPAVGPALLEFGRCLCSEAYQ